MRRLGYRSRLAQGEGHCVDPVDAPTHFQEKALTATMMRSILGSVAQFEKEAVVSKESRGYSGIIPN